VPFPLAVSKILVVVQVSVLLEIELLMAAVGAERSWVMAWLAVLVQPFAPIAVTVYVAGVVTFNVAKVLTMLLPLLQE
jgi:hypothetical protein